MALALGILAQVPLWTTLWLEGGQDRVGNLPQPVENYVAKLKSNLFQDPDVGTINFVYDIIS